MKKTIILFTLILFANLAFAQTFQKGTNIINAGIGLGGNLGGLGDSRPAISASFEHGKWDIGGPGVISIGGYIGNTGYSYKNVGYTQKWNYTIIGARGAYHYNGFKNVPDLDVYGGLMLSYNLVNYSADNYSGPNSYGSGLGLYAFVGGRWFFTEKIGAFAELGHGISTLNVGVAIKL
ncbi:hypothetical protein ABDJ41_19260 [Pedobacter sp. ASV1-7]|uniref:hypothetical protein n=1 Tax=Pedobacter sp. ASV1-7 TaxID=3145237 RepID=UPI0032E895EE